MDRIRSDIHQPSEHANRVVGKHCSDLATDFLASVGQPNWVYVPAVDKFTGFTNKVVQLIESLVTSNHNLSHTSVAAALLIPLKCLFSIPSPISVPMFCSSISKAISWVMLTTDQEVKRSVSSLLVSGGSAMVCSLPKNTLVAVMKEQQPTLFAERLCLLISTSLPRDLDMFTHALQTISQLADAHSAQGPGFGRACMELLTSSMATQTQKHTDTVLELLKAQAYKWQVHTISLPAERHLRDLVKCVSLVLPEARMARAGTCLTLAHALSQDWELRAERGGPTGWQSVLLLMTHSLCNYSLSLLQAQQRNQQGHAPEHMQTECHPEEALAYITHTLIGVEQFALPTIAATAAAYSAVAAQLAAVEAQSATTPEAAVSAVEAARKAAAEAVSLSVAVTGNPAVGTVGTVQTAVAAATFAAMGVAAAESASQYVPGSKIAALAAAAAGSVATVRAAVKGLPYLTLVTLQQQPGLVVSVETLIRVTIQHSERGRDARTRTVMDLVVMLVPMFAGKSKLPSIRSRFVSLAATVRKTADARLSAEKNLMRGWCGELVGFLLNIPGMDSHRMVVIFASMLTMSYCDERVSGFERRVLLGSVPPGRLRDLYAELFDEVLPVGSRREQARAWGKYATDCAAVCPWMLPGCSSFECVNLSGSCEAALPTLLCTGCRRVRYCSLGCQREAWVNGHREVCNKLGNNTKNDGPVQM